jgi:hypothetical protein
MRKTPQFHNLPLKSRLPGQSLALAMLVFIVEGITGPASARTIHDQASTAFTFALTADMQGFSGPGTCDTSEYFRGAVEGVQAHGPGAFMVSLGDDDLPALASGSAPPLDNAKIFLPLIKN